MAFADDTLDLGARIRSWRKQRGVSQVELARLVGRSQQQISHIENGTSDVTMSMLQAIAEALELGAVVALLDGRPADGVQSDAALFAGLAEVLPRVSPDARQLLADLLQSWQARYPG